MTKVLLDVSDEQNKKLDHIANFVKTKRNRATRQKTRILRFCIDKTYELYKEIKV